jgi:hypothetical protein
VPYKSAVGSLMYAMVATRADLTFAISTVSQHMATPGWTHWMAVKMIMRYLKGSLHLKLQLGGQHIKLKGYCDVDWTGDVNDRRSTTGYAFSLGDGIVSWSSKRQPTVALSTTKAEYMAASHCTREAIWLRQLLDDMRCKYNEGTLIMYDNQGAIALTKNPANICKCYESIPLQGPNNLLVAISLLKGEICTGCMRVDQHRYF